MYVIALQHSIEVEKRRTMTSPSQTLFSVSLPSYNPSLRGK